MRVTKKYKGEYIITNKNGVEFTASQQVMNNNPYWSLSSWEVDGVHHICDRLKDCKGIVLMYYSDTEKQ